MDVFSKITISHFIWYLVPGLGLLLFLLFPFLVFSPGNAKSFLETIGPFGIIMLAIVLGFSLDGLRLYRFRPNYYSIRSQFFNQLKVIIGNVDPYFIQSHISDVARSKNVSGLGLHHAIWIMLGQFTVLAFLEALFWLTAALYFHFSGSFLDTMFGENVSKEFMVSACCFFMLFFLLIGVRFVKISIEDQKSTNTRFTSFAIQHRNEIRRLLNIHPDD